MQRPWNEEVSTAWRALSQAEGKTDSAWRTIPLAKSDTFELQAGRYFPGNHEALLVKFPGLAIPSDKQLPEGFGFLVDKVRFVASSDSWVALVRQTEGSLELFEMMVADIFVLLKESQRGPSELYLIFLNRIRAWQDFMKNSQKILGPEAELGLIGELRCIEQLIEAGIDKSVVIESWKGPNRGLQDFKLGSGAFEVKSTLSSTSFMVTIDSLEQLDDSICSPIFLVAYRYLIDPNGKTLSELVDRISESLATDVAALAGFRMSLSAAGFMSEHSKLYTRHFLQASSALVQITADFPRLTHGTLPAGIVEARYQLDVTATLKNSLSLDHALQIVGAA